MFRTIKNGDRYLERWDWLVVGLIAIVVPPLIAFALGATFLLLGQIEGVPVIVDHVAGLFMAQVIAPIITILAMPFAILIGTWAARVGWAGWIMSILVPAGGIGLFMALYAQTNTGYTPMTYVQPALIFCFSGGLHGIVMWLALRWRRPEALARR